MVQSGLYQERDTIAAISTAVSASGIGIVRISGPDAVVIADRMYRSPKNKKKLENVPSHTIHYGWVADGEDVIDEVLVAVMRAPRTFTAEDTVEVNCHGGVLAMRRVLETAIRCGARPAEPGEFTKRAFLNGRIDLSRAEAVMDVIDAKSRIALQNSVRQAGGSLYRRISSLRAELLEEMAHIEASLDDPENLDYTPALPALPGKLDGWEKAVRRLLSTARSGHMLKEGVRTVLAGKPNAGKSSLMNLLLGQDRAIVTDIAGTTRDVLTESIDLDGIPLLITDTAGIRETEDTVERIGVDRALSSIREADLILWLIDSASGLDENDEAIRSLLPGHRTVILLNKTDLAGVVDEDGVREFLREDGSPEHPIISFSALDGTGYEKLVQTVKDLLFDGALPIQEEVVITNLRHRELLEKAAGALSRVRDSLKSGMSEDFFSIDLMEAYGKLGEIIGEEVGEDLVNEIFSRFCMGK